MSLASEGYLGYRLNCTPEAASTLCVADGLSMIAHAIQQMTQEFRVLSKAMAELKEALPKKPRRKKKGPGGGTGKTRESQTLLS